MIPELGSFAIILALCFALLQSTSFSVFFRPYAKTAALAQFIFLSIGMLCLIGSFLLNDMSVIYVRDHSHALLPFIYRVGAAWGGHEGSVLLWCLILAGWTNAFILFSREEKNEPAFFAKIIATLGVTSTGFIAFLFFTSNPFLRDFPTDPIVGNDLVPILQDPGLIFHPPMLYLGYVGFVIGFAFAIAALLEGNFTSRSAFLCRPWIILPWSFLSCGIVLGSLWAYRELGWGGWWFWDPVENASLLPWLSATALLHCLIVSEKRNTFKGWTILLAIITFALSLLGTFLVRSGVLVSVHAFASDPTRGLYLLAYLTFLIGGAFLLYAFKIKQFYQTPNFNLFSRETFLLVNSVFLITAVFTIVLGTLYPIILDALNIDKISVGEPYFNTVFVPIILPLLLLMGFAPHTKWGNDHLSSHKKRMLQNAALSILLALGVLWFSGFTLHFMSVLGLSLGMWILVATFHFILRSQNPLSLSTLAMIIAHTGIAIIVIGITVNKSYSDEKQVKLAPHESVELAGYQFQLTRLNEITGPNYRSINAYFSVAKGSKKTHTLLAEQRIYLSHEQTLSKPGILINPFRDLYVALGAPLENNYWTVRLYYKPLVRFIWFGGFLLLAGGVISLLQHLLRSKQCDL